MNSKIFEERLRRYNGSFAQVVPLTATDRLLTLDFTAANTELTEEILNDTARFSAYINNKLQTAGARYGIGGYNEHRTIYSRSDLFGPSPAASRLVEEGAKAPSRWEGDDQSESIVEEDTIGYRNADPMVYGLLKHFAQQNRAVPTQAEEVLWQVLKTKRLNAYKFRRQHIIDRFIGDFVCLKKRLVIEVDGLIHQLPEQQISDEQRTQRLNQLGFDVIRFSNDEVLYTTDAVEKKIEAALFNRHIDLPPLNSVGEDEGFYEVNVNKNSPQSEQRSEGLLPTGKAGMGLGALRRLHLGTDIWGAAHTPVFAPLEGRVHSFAFNNNFGDYGATLILQHELEGLVFHSLYGHLSLASIETKKQGQLIERGELVATFGIPEENGHWPPHLHLQLVLDMQGMEGDYPGVCRYSERESYLQNCPDPAFVLGLNGAERIQLAHQ